MSNENENPSTTPAMPLNPLSGPPNPAAKPVGVTWHIYRPSLYPGATPEIHYMREYLDNYICYFCERLAPDFLTLREHIRECITESDRQHEVKVVYNTKGKDLCVIHVWHLVFDSTVVTRGGTDLFDGSVKVEGTMREEGFEGEQWRWMREASK